MYKKLLVFSLAFCLGLIVWQLSLKRTISNSTTVSENSKKIENNYYQTKSDNFLEATSAQNLEGNSRFGVAGADNDKEVKDLYLTFQKAVAEDDRKTVASLMEYPLRVNFPNDKPTAKYTFLKNRKTFLNVYGRIFDDRFKKFIAKIDVEKLIEHNEDIWARYDGISVGRGVIWIGVYCFNGKCGDDKYYIKFRTLHADSNLMNLD